MTAAPIGIAFTREQRFELVSAELCRLLGRTEQALLGEHVRVIYAEEAHMVETAEAIARTFPTGEAYVGEWPMRRADGSLFHAQLRGCPIDLVRPEAGTIWTLTDVSAQVASRQRLEWSATHDPLTGLANRKLLDQTLRGLFERPDAREWAAVVVIDLDHFKPVNDEGGHAAGDAMLTAVAQAIGACVRANDLVARTGGDEFAVVLDGCPETTALRIAENIRVAIGAIALNWQGRTLQVGASLGVARLHAATASVEGWLSEADARCYAAKRAGRGSIRAGDAREAMEMSH